jgi:predicted nucleic acid-binding protein
MSIYIDADAFIRWEKGEFDLPTWLSAQGNETMAIPATIWQQILFGAFAWNPERAAKRSRFLAAIRHLPIVPFSRAHAERAAELAADLRLAQIGFADFQIAATALEDRAKLLTFNIEHFRRVVGLQLADI